MFSAPYWAMAAGSVRPTVPTSGWEKTAVGMLL